MYATINFIGKHVIQINPSKSAKGYSETYICADNVCNKGENYMIFMFWGGEFQKDAPTKEIIVLNKSSLDRDWAREPETGGGEGGGGGQANRQRQRDVFTRNYH